ncbi:hypothetical protein GUJ93_ZPchr0010g10750 [Zizania palustris]|uniref:Uncharacterized protein n=1 Tax=Zizania palustris TaxID=103762 RepID=A0A8J5WFV1_ZIZPA|nr:hypothetical protein GUJ93_ZPchr0010g10750 [Zizania palustris]
MPQRRSAATPRRLGALPPQIHAQEQPRRHADSARRRCYMQSAPRHCCTQPAPHRHCTCHM